MLDPKSPLEGILEAGGPHGALGSGRLRLGETRGLALTQIAAFAATLPDLAEAVLPVLGQRLPDRVGNVLHSGRTQVMKIGAQQFWITSPASADPLGALLEAVPPEVGSVTQLSHSRTRFFVDGTESRQLLSKGIALDLHAEKFLVDEFAVTGLHHVPVLLHRSGEYRYEVYAMRTFALSLWEWLIDAALPFGYDIGIDRRTSGKDQNSI